MGKLRFFMCLGLVVVALSCVKEIDGLPFEEGAVELTVRATTSQTRAADTSFDDNVTSLQVFLFSSDGKLESVAYSESDNVSLRTFTGEKSLYVVANHSKIDWSLETKASDLPGISAELSDERWNVMVGSCELYVDETSSASGSPIPVTVEVKRIAARIAIHKITNATTDSLGFKETDVNVRAVYITNVVGNACLSAVSSDYSYALTTWYNMMGNTGDLPELLYSGTVVSIKHGETKDIGQYFYCYPNPTKKDINLSGTTEWEPRFTRLVVEVDYGSLTETYYYVVSFGGVSSGYSYEITELTLEQQGSLSPEDLKTHPHIRPDIGGEEDEGGEGGDWEEHNPYLSSRRSLTEDDGGGTVVYFTGGHAEVRECGL